ncbi:MAG TPA: RsmD family RNA methyltransferase [Vicinamibacterales bacterium]|nr:RsmD family RNA methyltransferase [Vicinamibacterales bacterium]
MTAGDRLSVTIEKAVAGGRMLARHEGAVVLVSGAIPGEAVEVEIEKLQRGTAWARTTRVIDRAPDRIDAGDTACGGNVLAHVRYERQLTLKRDILRDAFTRIARLPVDDFLVEGSPTRGYRMRARLHVVHGRIGFFREGTHEWCDPAATGQLLPETLSAVTALEAALRARPDAAVVDVEVAENCPGDQRAFHLLVPDDRNPSRVGPLPAGADVTGISCGRTRGGRPRVVWGSPEVTDTIVVPGQTGEYAVSLTRQAHAFFQGNRYLLAPLVAAVADAVPAGRVLDLYAGVGLFSVALAKRGDTEVVAVEGDRTAAHDLKFNASRAGGQMEMHHQTVEAFLATRAVPSLDTVIVDPPRTGMTREALRGAIALRAARVAYLSCDVATLARDARLLVDAGYRLGRMRAFDLFPNTAHIETLAIFER